jgi:gliding motility-associated protein GldM
MAGGNLSPRQKMINMMYLVLTALLALNVSKEVLNSFFEVNKGIERTTTNFNSKNGDTYAEFDNAVVNNPEKYQEVRDKAFSIKAKADALVDSLQKMKYNLVLAVDNIVYLGTEQQIREEDGDLIEEMGTESSWDELSAAQKSKVVGYLNAKDNRDQAGALFYDVKKSALTGKDTPATSRKIEMGKLKELLLSVSTGNDRLQNSITETFNLNDRKQNDGRTIKWEYHNFYDMPAVGALTLLSKTQSDIRNAEGNVIDYLKKDIDATSLKFAAAEGIQIPKSNFVIKGDTFRSQIFITANNPDQNPDILVGEYDSLGNGNYEMKGELGVDYEAVRVVNGKGIFATKTNSEGVKNWGGLIKMKTETGTKFYTFKGEYLVAAKTAVVSPTKMNILYSGLEAIGGNPIQISVPGYTAGEITPSMTNGTLKVSNKSKGLYNVFPVKGKRSAIITLYANVDGKRTNMGKVDFRIRKTPPPAPVVRSVDANGLCDRAILKTEIVQATLENFLFDGLKYKVTSFKLSGFYKGAPASSEQKNGMNFTKEMQTIIANAASGSTVNITKIRAQLIGSNLPSEAVKGDLVIEIK